jgi:hypothetical protein
MNIHETATLNGGGGGGGGLIKMYKNLISSSYGLWPKLLFNMSEDGSEIECMINNQLIYRV